MLLCLVSFIGVLAAAPEPSTRLQLVPQDFSGADTYAHAPHDAFFGDSVTAEVWGRGQLSWRHLRMLLRSSPYAHNGLRQSQLRRLNPGEAHWRLQNSARVSRLPHERRVRLELRQSNGGLHLTGGLEALDAELAPAEGFDRRLVRRFGPTMAVRWRPSGASGRHGLHGLSASARLWPMSPQGPVWDLAANISTGFRSRAKGCPTLWGQAAIRHFAGGGDALLQGGHFQASDALHLGASTAPKRTLRTHVRGFEDATWYTTRQANVDLGICVTPTEHVDVELFASVGAHARHAKTTGSNNDVLQAATGAAMQVRGRIGNRPIALRYQVAMRHQGSRDPILHMVTASL